MATSNPYYEAHAALDLHLKGFDSLPESDDARMLVQWENTVFEPDPDEPWISVNFIPEVSNDPTIGLNPNVWVRGTYQMVVNAPTAKGPWTAEKLADGLLRHFGRQYLPLFGSVYVRLSNPRRGLGVEDLNWYRITVDAPWRFSTNAL